jgi:hypothetical protein
VGDPPPEIRVLQILALTRLTRGRTAARPHLFETVERADFRSEDVDNHVAGVNQHPIAMGQALDPDASEPDATKVLKHLVGHCSHMAIGPSRGHNHVVGDCRLSAQIDCGGVLRLHVVEAREDDTKRLIGVRTHLRDEVGIAASAAPRDRYCGQRSFPFGSAAPGTLPGATP